MNMTLFIIGVYLLGGVTAYFSVRKAMKLEYETKIKQQRNAAVQALLTYKRKMLAKAK